MAFICTNLQYTWRNLKYSQQMFLQWRLISLGIKRAWFFHSHNCRVHNCVMGKSFPSSKFVSICTTKKNDRNFVTMPWETWKVNWQGRNLKIGRNADHVSIYLTLFACIDGTVFVQNGFNSVKKWDCSWGVL